MEKKILQLLSPKYLWESHSQSGLPPVASDCIGNNRRCMHCSCPSFGFFESLQTSSFPIQTHQQGIENHSHYPVRSAEHLGMFCLKRLPVLCRCFPNSQRSVNCHPLQPFHSRWAATSSEENKTPFSPMGDPDLRRHYLHLSSILRKIHRHFRHFVAHCNNGLRHLCLRSLERRKEQIHQCSNHL